MGVNLVEANWPWGGTGIKHVVKFCDSFGFLKYAA